MNPLPCILSSNHWTHCKYRKFPCFKLCNSTAAYFSSEDYSIYIWKIKTCLPFDKARSALCGCMHSSYWCIYCTAKMKVASPSHTPLELCLVTINKMCGFALLVDVCVSVNRTCQWLWMSWKWQDPIGRLTDTYTHIMLHVRWEVLLSVWVTSTTLITVTHI